MHETVYAECIMYLVLTNWLHDSYYINVSQMYGPWQYWTGIIQRIRYICTVVTLWSHSNCYAGRGPRSI